MKLKLERFKFGEHDTCGRLFINGKFACFTLEDEVREVKVRGETCIPEGEYKLTLRTVGGFHSRYARKFPHFHKGMLWLRDVPGFEYILIHCGNTDADTAGCLLVGDSLKEHAGKHFLTNSVKTYSKIYPAIAKALETGEEVIIEVTRSRESV